MPPRAAPQAGAANEQQQQPSMVRTVIKYFALYWLVTSGSTLLLSPQSPIAKFIKGNAPGPSSGGDPGKTVPVPSTPAKTTVHDAAPFWPANSQLTLSVYLSLDGTVNFDRPTLPYHKFEPFQYGDWKFSQSWETEFDVPVVGHTFLLRATSC